MTGMEIALLILGVIVFIASFVVPETMYTPDEETVKLSEEKINEMVDGKIRDAKDQIQDTIDETISYAMEKAERSLERVSNEKITAVSEFSETVLSDINKNHQEVMFMYDMLHDKQKNLRETVIQADKTNAMAKETKTELELVTKQLQEETKAEETMQQTLEEATDEALENQFEAIDFAKEVIEPKAAKKTRKSSKGVSAKTGKIIEPVSMPVIGDAKTESINNNDRILELHKKGKSNIAIAKELGLGVGEVNLVIDLFEVM